MVKVLHGIARAMKEAWEGGIGTSELPPRPRLKNCYLRPARVFNPVLPPVLEENIGIELNSKTLILTLLAQLH